MLSGNGRHRRPRQAPALLVAAGVTGSAIAIPLIGAGGASAADGNAWDKVAKCESGGAWSADTGNGYYGGLQLTQDDWEKYGGLDYASSADQASRSQQIAVAEKLLADKGPGAWPTCGLLSGLSKKSGAAKVDTGVGDSSGSSNSSGKSLTDDLGLSDSSQTSSGDTSGSSDSSDVDPGSTDSSGSSVASPTTSSPSPSSPAKKGEQAESDASSDVAAGGSQSPAASPSVTAQPDYTDNSWQVGGTSALVDTGALSGGRHRGGSAVEDPADSHSTASSGRHASRGGSARAVVADSYTVRAGDSLESIADSLDLPGGWDALYAANKGAIGSDPNHISAGQTLNVPTETPQK
ncbi:transglycosylase family protein [Streptomyces sp. NPDC001212]|uniref:LysM peptidoglycan-binding domain-containing protein n=1 Tax=Streptomyces sp. CoT10 TaxID=2875762 RepID=UPI001CD25BCC|nr:transglycosylase family protein [Streptomyces sp. CoT10]